MGPLFWFHVAEIASGASLGIALAANFLLGLAFASSGPYLLKDASEDQITYSVVAGFNFLCFLFYVFVLKDSKGLTETEKRNLYLRHEE